MSSPTLYTIINDITPNRGTVVFCGSADDVLDVYYEAGDEQARIIEGNKHDKVGDRVRHENKFYSPDDLL